VGDWAQWFCRLVYGWGDLVFREVNGRTILSRKPTPNGTEPSADQVDQRELFRQAVAYGRSVMANQATREFYEQVAEQRGTPIFSLTVADFLNRPSIRGVDTSAYQGQIADTIRITTHDDFGVMNVHVGITNAQGAVIESGNAVEDAAGTGRWTYTATAAAPAGSAVVIQVVATDRPGGMAVSTITKNL